MLKMTFNVLAAFGCMVALQGAPATGSTEPNAEPQVETQIDELMGKMTLEEKVSMLGGDETGFNSAGVARLRIPPLRMSDGPVGVRTGAATAFPVSVNMAASWDLDLVHRYGIALGEETKAKGKNCILGPCVGIHRFPLNGRNFESFGEDPFLSSRLVVEYIHGVQSQDVIATVKHFACNDQEWERTNYDVQVDERTLREIHLPAFEAAVKEGQVRAVMSAYNIVNGEHCSENKHLLTDILKNDWGFKGIVMSDWVSVYSADHAANNGLDTEMPQPVWLGEKLLAAIKDGRVSEATINDKIRRHLRVRLQAGIFANPQPKEDESVVRSESHRKLALEMAQKSIVLLKNDGVLPLTKSALKKVALIGPCAKVARTGGGGSSMVQPWESVSPSEGMAALLGKGVELKVAEGTNIDGFRHVVIPSRYLKTSDGTKNGLLGEYFDNPRFEGKPLFTRVDGEVNFRYNSTVDSPDPRLKATDFSIRWTGKFIPTESRSYQLVVTSDDGSMLYIDGKLMVDNWGVHGEVAQSCDVPMEAGKAYDIRIDYYQGGGGAVMEFGWKDPADSKSGPTIADAVEAAKAADIAIVCVGNTSNTEGEGADVKDFLLSGSQDELVQAVAKANPNTVVVVYGGVPVLMKNWVNQVRGVVAALYPGQEGGTALAQILLGEVNPSAKLPFSYIQDRSQSPAFIGYKDPSLRVHYSEGVFVGYRYYDKNNIEPLFPFGFGLSYTTFHYENLKVTKTGAGTCTATVEISNTGKVAGEEVVQLYVAPAHSAVPRPIKELKAFAKVSLQPGEAKTVTLSLTPRSFEYYSPEKKDWVLESGEYELRIGASSRDIRLVKSVRM